MDVQTGVLDMETLFSRSTAQTLLDSEIPLPEGREAAAVLSAGAALSVDEAECMSGQTRVAGGLSLSLVCVTPSDEAFGFTASASFTHRLEADGVLPGMRASVDAQVLECRCEAHGRTLRLTAVVELTATVFSPVSAPFVTGVSGASGLEARMAGVECRRRVLLAEGTLRIREEVSTPGAAEVVRSSAAAVITNVTYAGASAELSGRLVLTLLTADEHGELSSTVAPVPFTDVLEAPYAAGAWAEAAVLSLSATPADADFGVTDVEAVLRIRLYGVETREYTVLQDAYDEKATFTCARTRVERLQADGCRQKCELIRDNVLIPKHLPEARRPVHACVVPVVTGTGERDGRLVVDLMLLTTAVFRCDGGLLHSFTEDIPVSITLDAAFTPDTLPKAIVLSAQLAGAGRTLELACEVSVSAEVSARQTAELVSEITAGCDVPPYRGILIYCVGAGESVWDVGKRFHVPVARLRSWNTNLTEPLREGEALVLVK